MFSQNYVLLVLLLSGMLLVAGCTSSSAPIANQPAPAPPPSAKAPGGQPAAPSNPTPSQTQSGVAPAGDMHPLVPASAATPPSNAPIFPTQSMPTGSAAPTPASKTGAPAAPPAVPSPSTTPTAPPAAPATPSTAPPAPPAPNASASGNDSQYGYKGGVPFGEITFSHPNSTADPSASIPGAWRVYSSRVFYDIGGAGGMTGAGSSQTLTLDPSGTWTYGSSSGTYSVASITDADWTKWKVKSYGPVYKLVLNNWNDVGADGPIEVSATTADFIWVIYHVEPPLVQKAGNVQTKFGH